MPEETAAKQHGDEATKSIILLNNKPCYVRFAKITKTTPRGSYTPRHTRIYAPVHSSESRPFPFILSPWEIIALIDRDAIFPLFGRRPDLICGRYDCRYYYYANCMRIRSYARHRAIAGNQWCDAIIYEKWINSHGIFSHGECLSQIRIARTCFCQYFARLNAPILHRDILGENSPISRLDEYILHFVILDRIGQVYCKSSRSRQ